MSEKWVTIGGGFLGGALQKHRSLDARCPEGHDTLGCFYSFADRFIGRLTLITKP